MENERPLLVLRPKFQPIATLLSGIPRQLVATVFVGGFCGGLIGFFSQWPQSEDTQILGVWPLSCLAPIAILAIITFFGAPISNYVSKKIVYAKTEYRFFSTRMEVHETFFGVIQKTIDYSSIIEINMRQGWIQKKFGLGDLMLSTPATGTAAGVPESGVVLTDLENPKKVYQQIRVFWSQRTGLTPPTQ